MPSEITIKKTGEVVKVKGCYTAPPTVMYLFKAFHIEHQDGTKETILAKEAFNFQTKKR